MLRLIKEDTHIDFLGKWKLAAVFSSALLLTGLVAYFPMGGLNYGIDFLGGTLVQLQFQRETDLGAIRGTLAENGFGTFELQQFGEEDANEVLITLPAREEEEALGSESRAERIGDVLTQLYPDLDVRRVESVGPKVGEELKQAAAAAVLFALLAILAYVWLRFQWRYGVAAIAATVHDVLFVLAVFVFVQHEITLPVVAAVLTVAGYSINDSIVILDRIRDNVRRYQKMTLTEIINESVNQTLSRTLLTSGTTLLVVLSIYIFGGEIIRDFAFALIIGIVIGTYSTIYIASPLLLGLHRWFPVKTS